LGQSPNDSWGNKPNLGADTNTGNYDVFPNIFADGPHRFFITERGDYDTMELRHPTHRKINVIPH
jgi:hypothetical protein